jgi:hypothetical protein
MMRNGNPFFVRELLRRLIDGDQLERSIGAGV